MCAWRWAFGVKSARSRLQAEVLRAFNNLLGVPWSQGRLISHRPVVAERIAEAALAMRAPRALMLDYLGAK